MSSTDVWAGGSSQDANHNSKTLIANWDGEAWRKVSSPNPDASVNEPYGVSLDSATDGRAVGNRDSSLGGIPFILHWNGTGGLDTLAVHWSGTKWKRT